MRNEDRKVWCLHDGTSEIVEVMLSEVDTCGEILDVICDSTERQDLSYATRKHEERVSQGSRVMNGSSFVCYGCGTAISGLEPGTATWHEGECQVCDNILSVTQFRDFTGKKHT